MQLSAKFKKILYMGFRATLNFREFKVALNPLRRIFFKLCKKLSLFFSYKRLKLKLRVFLAGHIVAMVTYCVTKIIPTCSPVIGQFFDTMIVALIDKEW